MFSAGTDYILNESVANNFARFSVQAQSENVEPYRVEIERKHNLSRDKMSQLSSSCSCPHFQKRKIKFCKHIIYVILCKYVRPQFDVVYICRCLDQTNWKIYMENYIDKLFIFNSGFAFRFYFVRLGGDIRCQKFWDFPRKHRGDPPTPLEM